MLVYSISFLNKPVALHKFPCEYSLHILASSKTYIYILSWGL